MEMALRIAVMGSGGIGGYVGARLAQAGAIVTFIARGAHLAAMQDKGLRVLSPNGDVHLAPTRAVSDPRDVGGADIVLFAVKMRDTEDAARAIKPLVDGGPSVVTFQNGVESADRLAAILGREAVIPGTALIAAAITEPGVIKQTGAIARLTFGELDGMPRDRTDRLFAACKEAGIDAVLSTDMKRDLWNKFVPLTVFSGLTAVTRGPIGPIMKTPATRRLAEAALRESTAVAAAHGVAFDEASIAQRMAFMDGLPPAATSSMCHDLMAGKPLEIDGLSGTVARLGAAKGIATPVHAFIADVLAVHAAGRPAD
jgi:2-dehydropantoate 2-reductase